MLAFSNDYYGMIFRATQSVELFCAYREAAVLQAYTGFKMLEGFDQEYAEQYINELLGEPCTSPHQLLTPKEFYTKVKELSKPDFIKICQNLTDD